MSEAQAVGPLLERAEQAAMAGDLASAEALLRDAARLQESHLGPHHPDLANTLNNLAIVSERLNRFDEAESFFRRAASIAAASLPSGHPMVVESRKNLEDFCRARGLSVDAPQTGRATASPAPAARQATETVSPRSPSTLGLVAAVVIVLAVAVILFLRPWSTRATPDRAPAAAATPVRSVAPAPPPAVEAPPSPTPSPAPPPAASPASSPPAAPPAETPPVRPAPPAPPATRASGTPAVASVQLCSSLTTDGSRQCSPADEPAAPGQLTLLTRIKSSEDTTVVHRWSRGGVLRQSVQLAVKANAGEGYRTFSRQTVTSGEWRVEIRDLDGAVLHEQTFTVR